MTDFVLFSSKNFLSEVILECPHLKFEGIAFSQEGISFGLMVFFGLHWCLVQRRHFDLSLYLLFGSLISYEYHLDTTPNVAF